MLTCPRICSRTPLTVQHRYRFLWNRADKLWPRSDCGARLCCSGRRSPVLQRWTDNVREPHQGQPADDLWWLAAGVGEVQRGERHSCIHQEGVWQKVQSHMALYCWQKLWWACFLPAPSSLPKVLKLSVDSWLLAGSYVTHETKHFIYFYLGKHHHLHLQHQIWTQNWKRLANWLICWSCPAGQVAVLLFKSGWATHSEGTSTT